MTDPVLDLEWEDEPVVLTAKFDRTKADTDVWKIYEYCRGIGRPACKAEIAVQAGVDVSHVSQRIERGRNKLGMQFVGGKAGFGQDRLPLCECCRSGTSKGQQLYVLVSADILDLHPRDVGVHLCEEGDEVRIELETYEISARYSTWEKERLTLLLLQTYHKWKRTVGQV